MVHLANFNRCQGLRTAIVCAQPMRTKPARRPGEYFPSRNAFTLALALQIAVLSSVIPTPSGAIPLRISQTQKMKRGLYVYQA
jgi:hypothetical protein